MLRNFFFSSFLLLYAFIIKNFDMWAPSHSHIGFLWVVLSFFFIIIICHHCLLYGMSNNQHHLCVIQHILNRKLRIRKEKYIDVINKYLILCVCSSPPYFEQYAITLTIFFFFFPTYEVTDWSGFTYLVFSF